jgi:hypothetical protein
MFVCPLLISAAAAAAAAMSDGYCICLFIIPTMVFIIQE